MAAAGCCRSLQYLTPATLNEKASLDIWAAQGKSGHSRFYREVFQTGSLDKEWPENNLRILRTCFKKTSSRLIALLLLLRSRDAHHLIHHVLHLLPRRLAGLVDAWDRGSSVSTGTLRMLDGARRGLHKPRYSNCFQEDGLCSNTKPHFQPLCPSWLKDVRYESNRFCN